MLRRRLPRWAGGGDGAGIGRGRRAIYAERTRAQMKLGRRLGLLAQA
jgi:hypothetical protein